MATGDLLFSTNVDSKSDSNLARPARRGAHSVMNMDWSPEESVTFDFIIPPNYTTAADIQFDLVFFMSSAATGNVRLKTEMMVIDDSDLTTFGTAVNSSIMALSGVSKDTRVITTTHDSAAELDSAAVGDSVSVKVTYVSSAGGEAAADLQLFQIQATEV